MHVCVGGSPAIAPASTVLWHIRQLIPSPATWCSWLNGTGCGSTKSVRRTQSVRGQTHHQNTANSTIPPAPSIAARRNVSAVGVKIGIRGAVAASRCRRSGVMDTTATHPAADQPPRQPHRPAGNGKKGRQSRYIALPAEAESLTLLKRQQR